MKLQKLITIISTLVAFIGITEFLIAVFLIQYDKCIIEDSIINIKHYTYLATIGIIDICTPLNACLYLPIESNKNGMICSFLLIGVFNIIWFIIGGIIIFRNNIECINQGNPSIIIMLISWSMFFKPFVFIKLMNSYYNTINYVHVQLSTNN